MIKKYFSPVLLIISLFLLVYTIYKSEIRWDGANRDYYFTYYTLSSVFIFFSIISFFFNEKVKIYFLILITSIISSLYIFEVYLTYAEINKKNIDDNKLKRKMLVYKLKSGNDYDTRSTIEVFESLKADDKKIVLPVHPSTYLSNEDVEIFPLSGISNSKTLNCNENGFYSIYQSDRFGFNNPDTEWDKEKLEYLLVGDSMLHGDCVNRPDDITSVLRKLSGKSAINLGYGGNGPLIEFATLREYLRPNVKNVLWLYYEDNDLKNIGWELQSKIISKYLKNDEFSQNLKSKQDYINLISIKKIENALKLKKNENKEVKKKFYFSDLILFIKISKTRKVFNNYLPRKYKPKFIIPKPPNEFKEILKKAKALSVSNKSNFYFVYLPGYERYKRKLDISYVDIKNIVEELNIPFIDIHEEVFNKEKTPLQLFPFEDRGHYNIAGYNKVAEEIYNFILNN